MFLWTRKSGHWKWSTILSMSLSDASKYKTDNLSLIPGNVAELHHQSVLLIEVSGKTLVHPHYLSICYIKLQFVPYPIESFDLK